ncbi:hypothetical protein GCM10026983_41890 [Gracilibacillus alcaliphilus]
MLWLVGIGLLLLVAACSNGKKANSSGQQTPDTTENEDEIVPEIELEYDTDVSIHGSTAIVEGTTNLENGALIRYNVTNYEVMEMMEIGETEVQDGTFTIKIDISEYDEGEYEVYSSFNAIRQPDEIQEIYGPLGERIKVEGPVTDEGLTENARIAESVTIFNI